MLYLIPAWYKLNTWSESEQCWYVRREKSEYDDTVKQVQLFHRNRAWAYRIIVLSHVPNFRHFLHRQSIFRARYWSCFDAMCEITKRKMRVFSFKVERYLSQPFTSSLSIFPIVYIAMKWLLIAFRNNAFLSSPFTNGAQ